MGLNLSERSSIKKKEKKLPSKKQKSLRAKSKHATAAVSEDDEIITADSSDIDAKEQSATETVQSVGAFEGGLVHPLLNGAVNAYWRKSPESELFFAVLSTVRVYEGTFFGSIYVKSSFLRKTGGSALL